ncbi:hypothetical protein [Aquimarina sp. 2304DJ70-9]|uniref:hypothetical protein n=1 Tax=Aquimarina penaris TaxID=3231044 RepID=UPI00346331A2
MKHALLLLLLIAPFIELTAQESIKVDSQKTIVKLNVGDSADFNSKRIKFIKVIEDSRCPSDVTCIWAGQATASIELYEDGILKEEKELVFGAKAINPNNTKEVLVTKEKTIYAYTISPYPLSEKPIIQEEYCLELLIK